MDGRGGVRVRAGTDVATAAIGLVLLAALVYGDHVLRGGLLWDDWENAATTHYRYEDGFLGPFDLRLAAYRPLLALLLPLPHLVFGSAAPLHLALALALAVAAATAFYALLRELGARREFALAAAALALVFPWSDSTRLWATASLNLVAPVLFFVAATLALRRPAERVWLTAGLLVAAVFTYEAVAGLVLLLPALYTRRMPRAVVLRRWRVEAAAAGVAAVLVAALTTKPEGGGLGHLMAMAGGGVALLGHALAPLGWVAAVALASAVAVTAQRASLRPIALSLAALVLAWAPFVPGEDKYVPTAPGIYDRVNIVAGFAIAALVCSLAGLARARVIQVAVVVAVGAGWMLQGRAHVADYERAAGERAAELAAIERAVPHPPEGARVVAVGGPRWAAPGVPVFGNSWDLGGALKVAYGDATIDGKPAAPGSPVSCEPHLLVVDVRRARRVACGQSPPR
jgi:hypothetical protein